MSLKLILDRQRAWAMRRGVLEPGRDYVRTMRDALFMPLHAQSEKELNEGDGHESMAKGGRPPRMQSLRSSTTLAVNFFDPWRIRPFEPLAAALQVSGIESLQFERKCPTGISVPNIDVFLTTTTGEPIGIECKFAEPYGGTAAYPCLAIKYFADEVGLWSRHGLPRSQRVAEAIGKDLSFKRLDAGQLLKHLLGMARLQATRGPLRLIYLWYDMDSAEAEEHRGEIAAFEQALNGEVAFRATTYQDVFRSLRHAGDTAHVEYMQERYFGN